MAFFKRSKQTESGTNKRKIPFYRKKGWKITFLFLGLILVFAVSFFTYAFSVGSKIFNNGVGGYSILKTIYGKEQLKGEDQDRINILFLGMGGPNHPGGMLSDSIMVLSIQPKEKKAALLSIPRDLLVPIPSHGDDKINSAFADGYNDYLNKSCAKKNKNDCYGSAVDAGAKLEGQTVANILNVPIHYYVVANFTGFEKIIDQLGGVDVYVDGAIYDPLFPAEDMIHYLPFKISAGQHHLDGKTALKYARSRETTSDFDRAARQQKVLKAVKDKAMQTGFISNPQKIIDVITTLGDSLKTDFTIAEIKSFALLVKDIQVDQIISKVLSTDQGGLLVNYSNGVYYERPRTGNFKEIQQMMQNIFSNQAVLDPAKIQIINGRSDSTSATKLSSTITNKGYKITEITNSKTKYAKTVIYDYSNGKQREALDYLKSGLGAEVAAKPTDTTIKSDITIILGSDYSGFSKVVN